MQSTITVLNCASSITFRRQYNSLADTLSSTKKKQQQKCFHSFTHLSKKIMISKKQAPVVQKVDNAIQWINHYPVNNAIGFPNTYPVGW